MSFLYYLPGVAPEQLTAATIREFDPPDDGRPYHRAFRLSTSLSELVEFPDLFESSIFKTGCIGPDGGKGVSFCPRPGTGREPNVRFDKSAQTWQVWKAGARPFWVGVNHDDPPTARELERDRHFTGEPVILGDGREWIAPIVRRSGVTPAVPCSYRIDPATGEFVETPDDRFAWAWELAGECFEELFGGQGFRLGKGNNADRFAAAALLLSLNYRVSLIECSLFLADDNSGGIVPRPLINSETAGHIIRAAVDAGLIFEMLESPEVKDFLRNQSRSDPLEKKNPDSLAESCSATGPPAV